MATYLHRLGGFAFEHRRKVLAAWLLVLAAALGSAAAFKGTKTDKFEVPGTESQQAQQLLEARFPGAGGASARVVFVAPAGEKLTDSANRSAVMASVSLERKAEGVLTVSDPYTAHAVSADGRTGYADVVYPVPKDQLSQSERDALAATAQPARASGLQVEFAGGIVTDSKHGSSEGLGMAIAYVVLAITLGSLLAAGMPLLTAALGVVVGVSALSAVSGVINVSTTAPILATMLGLAVGIDYALFILSRHRQHLGDGMEPREAAAAATATAGSAVVFAGLTVIIALIGLTVVNIPFLTVMGLAAAGTVAIAVLIAVTLLPALFGFAGTRLNRFNRAVSRREHRSGAATPKLARRWAGFVTRRPLPVLAVGLVALSALALPALHLKLGLPDDGSKSTSTTERRAYDLLTKGFGPGFNGPLTVVIDAPGRSPDEQKQLATQVVQGLEKFPGIAKISPPISNKAGDLTIVLVTPTTSPASNETKHLVSLLRDRAKQIPPSANVRGYVTGTTALNIDTADRLSAALPTYVAVVVGLALLLLMVVFRSILVPIKAAVGFLLSIATSMGVVVWIFQDGHLAGLFDVSNPGPVVSFLPVLLIGILFGLAMDYEVFLVTRMREGYTRTKRARESVVTGFGHSARVVTAAALIMTSVFGSFVLDDDPVVKSIGLSLAVGVLVDAFVVRMTLVPAAMALLGDRAWWLPRGLARRLPDLDIEGANLREAPARK